MKNRENNGNNSGLKFKLIHLILILLGLFGSGVAAWVWQQSNIATVQATTLTLKKEGCSPARHNSIDIAVIKNRLDSIDKNLALVRWENKESFKEIKEIIEKNK